MKMHKNTNQKVYHILQNSASAFSRKIKNKVFYVTKIVRFYFCWYNFHCVYVMMMMIYLIKNIY